MKRRVIFGALAAFVVVIAWPPEYFRVRRLRREMNERARIDALAWRLVTDAHMGRKS